MAIKPVFIDPEEPGAIEALQLSDVATLNTPMKEFYRGTNIFITGGTGFMGKVLTEKLLRMFPDINTIYLLARGKKGKDIESRMDTLYDDAVFFRLQHQHPKFRHKIVAVSGDCALPGLGLDIDTRALLTKCVNIVFHVAATVRFDEKLRLAVAINVAGTQEVLRLAHDMINLKGMLYTSTAYCNCHINSIDEQFYTPPMPYKKMFELVDACDDTLLDEITPTILGKWPNTYALTKAVAEDVVHDLGVGLPIVVFRPAIVVGVNQDPLPGYIDNMYGPTGVLYGAALGLLKTLHADPEALANLVPVDMSVNAMIASVWDIAMKQDKKEVEEDAKSIIPIYNYVSSCENPLTWHDYITLNERYGLPVPSIKSIWYYSFTVNKYLWIHMLYVMILHFLPGMFIDGMRYLRGEQPQMMKVYRKINKFSSVISYFSTRTWRFNNSNVQALWRRVSPLDQHDFLFDMKQLDWQHYFYNYIRGCRVFLAKDPLSTVPDARKKWRRLYWLHQAVKTICTLVFLRLVWFFVSITYNMLVTS